MGEITESLLNVLDIEYSVIGNELSSQEIREKFAQAAQVLRDGRQYAFVLKKDFLQNEDMETYFNQYQLKREDAIAEIINTLDAEDIVVSTTGKISREVYEQSNQIKGGHAQDF